MSFKTKKIRSDKKVHIISKTSKIKDAGLSIIKTNAILIVIICVAVFGIYKATAKVSSIISDISSGVSVKEILLSVISSPLDEDEYGHTNFLLLGIGGGDHDGGDLTDSIIIASLDEYSNLVPMLSIPRDLYVEYNEAGTYGDRINRYYELSKLDYEDSVEDEEEAQKLALEDTAEKVSEILGIEIHYYALIDFVGFVEVVDAIGGIDVYLESSFYDNAYPVEGTDYFQTFSLSSGDNHLDGETALKYARSRHTTSDFDRAIRQQEILNAIKDKTFSLGVLGSPGKLKDLYEAISDNFVTNLNFTEIAHLGKLADDFSGDSMLSQVFTDTPWETAGFLYAPPREMFNGAAVFLPSSGHYSEIQDFANLFLYHTDLFEEQIPLQIVNSTKHEGLATDTMVYLKRYGFNVTRYGNAARVGETQTTIFNLAGEELEGSKTLEYLQKMLPGAVITSEIPEDYSPINWETEADIIIEMGEDFIPYYEANYDARFYYWVSE